jgi:predicted kinase
MNKPTISVLVGVSGSGKTTYATDFINKNKNWVRVNRDDIRRQILGELTQDYYKNPKFSETEKHITVIHDEQIRYWILQGVNVIVDNTHLKDSYIKHYHNEFSHLADVKFKIFNISAQDCKERVVLREGHMAVDTSYIDRQHKEFQKAKKAVEEINNRETISRHYEPLRAKKRKKCIIVDIDGTVADCTGIRNPYDGDKLHLDNVIEPVKLLLKRFKGNFFQRLFNPITIIYLSGREDKWAPATIEWIKSKGLPYDGHMYMRVTKDMRKDSIVKEELYYKYVNYDFDTQFVIDDRHQVVDMWNRLGKFVINVNQTRKHF